MTGHQFVFRNLESVGAPTKRRSQFVSTWELRSPADRESTESILARCEELSLCVSSDGETRERSSGNTQRRVDPDDLWIPSSQSGWTGVSPTDRSRVLHWRDGSERPNSRQRNDHRDHQSRGGSVDTNDPRSRPRSRRSDLYNRGPDSIRIGCDDVRSLGLLGRLYSLIAPC
jgi:hypothetical protein